MSYVTNADIQAWIGTQAYIALTDDAGTGSADEAKVDAARLGAEGETNSYLATRYRVPVDITSEPEVAAVLKTFVLDLVSYRLHSRRPPVPDDIVRRREEAVTWLSRVASGVVQLPSAVSVRENAALGIVGQSAGPARAMTRDTLEDL
ncbi:MAG: gp436 family protein [Phycisphaerae bacterium]